MPRSTRPCRAISVVAAHIHAFAPPSNKHRDLLETKSWAMLKRIDGHKREEDRKGLSRRTFLVTGAAAGGGLLLGIYLPRTLGAKAQVGDETLAPNAFVRIRPDDTITLVMPQVEMGQGTYTSMSMLIAEELEADLSKVSLEAAPANEKLYALPLLGFQVTGGS